MLKNPTVSLIICAVIGWLSYSTNSFAQLSPAAARNSPSVSTERLIIELSTEAQDAINNGVTLYFDGEFGIRTSYWLFSTSKILQRHRFLLQRHALSNRYIVKRLDQESPRVFRSIAQATNYIAAEALMLLESYDDGQNLYSMRLSLNRFDLPGPMRLNAFISEAWDLDSGWIKWQSAN